MIHTDNVNVRRNWEECPRDPRENRWKTLYATLNPDGDLVISRHTHESLGGPAGYILLYDRERHVLGLRPAGRLEKHAYPAFPRGKHGGRLVRAFRYLREFGVDLDETVRFHHCQIDRNGVLILDLNDVRPARSRAKGSFRATSWRDD